MLICTSSTSLQQDAVAGRGWEWGDRWWPNLLPRHFCPGSSLGREAGRGGYSRKSPPGLATACQGSPGHSSGPACVLSQHEGNALSLLQGALTFLAKAGK